MTVEASLHVRETVQEILDGLAETHMGEHPEEIREAVQANWSARVGVAAPPIDDQKAREYAAHISNGHRVIVVLADEGMTRTRHTRHRTKTLGPSGRAQLLTSS
jgi:hypothetical protein